MLPTDSTAVVRSNSFKTATPFVLSFFILCTLVIFSAPIRSSVFLLISSCVLALLLDSPIIVLERRGISRLKAIFLVFIMLFVFIATAGWLLYPTLIAELQDLGALINNVQAIDGGDAGTTRSAIAAFGRYLTAEFIALTRASLGFTSSPVSSFFRGIIVIVIGFFFLTDGYRIKKSALNWVPNRHLEMTMIIVHRIGVGSKRYLAQQLPAVLLVGILSAAALHLLGVRFSLILAATAGLAQMIPYLGAVLGAIPAILVVLADGGSVGAVLAVAVAFASIEMIKNLGVSWLGIRNTVKLSPLATLIALVVGAQILGIPGMLFAVPVASLSKVGVLELRKVMSGYGVL